MATIAGVWLFGALFGAAAAFVWVWVQEVREVPAELARDNDAANDAYARGLEDGKRIERAEAKAKRRAAGLKAAQTRKLGYAIVGAE